MCAGRSRARLGIALLGALGTLHPRVARADAPPAVTFDADAASPGGAAVLLGPDDRASPGAAALRTAAEAPLSSRLSLRAGARQVGTSDPDAEARVVLRALGATAGGVRLDLAAGYEGRSFNGVPEAVAAVTLSAPLGAAVVVAEATYGHAAGTAERYGDLHVAAARPVTRALQVGLDARVSFDLQRDPGDSPAEPEWALAAGPTITWRHDGLFLRAAGGLSERRLRVVGTRQAGVGATLGIGVVY